jgi:hypothetical protein
VCRAKFSLHPSIRRSPHCSCGACGPTRPPRADAHAQTRSTGTQHSICACASARRVGARAPATRKVPPEKTVPPAAAAPRRPFGRPSWCRTRGPDDHRAPVSGPSNSARQTRPRLARGLACVGGWSARVSLYRGGAGLGVCARRFAVLSWRALAASRALRPLAARPGAARASSLVKRTTRQDRHVEWPPEKLRRTVGPRS